MAIPNSILISDHRYRFQPVIRMPEHNDSMQVSFATVCSTKIGLRRKHTALPKSTQKGISGLTSHSHRKHRIFLLSPANLAGIRAGYVLKANAASDLACRLRQNGVTLGELFTFVSGLYFRGKLAYARAFSTPPFDVSGSFVITASAGLLAPETVVTLERLREMAANDIDAGEPRYRAPLDRDCHLLLERLGGVCDIVLLGSIATSKYVDPLLQIFQDRLLFPREFVGRGDMSRGGLMLRSVEGGKELAYAPVLNAIRHGPKPPKLVPSSIRRSKSAFEGAAHDRE
jgi:hypothetical protein